jgi:hypothetical protein
VLAAGSALSRWRSAGGIKPWVDQQSLPGQQRIIILLAKAAW